MKLGFSGCVRATAMSGTSPSVAGASCVQESGWSVGIAGSRDFPYSLFPDRCLEEVGQAIAATGWPVETVITGGAEGADSAGAAWAGAVGVQVVEIEPDWEEHGKQAGPIRNSKMVKKADGVLALWNGTSTGTATPSGKRGTFSATTVSLSIRSGTGTSNRQYPPSSHARCSRCREGSPAGPGAAVRHSTACCPALTHVPHGWFLFAIPRWEGGDPPSGPGSANAVSRAQPALSAVAARRGQRLSAFSLASHEGFLAPERGRGHRYVRDHPPRRGASYWPRQIDAGASLRRTAVFELWKGTRCRRPRPV